MNLPSFNEKSTINVCKVIVRRGVVGFSVGDLIRDSVVTLKTHERTQVPIVGTIITRNVYFVTEAVA